MHSYVSKQTSVFHPWASWTAGRNIPLTRNNVMLLHERGEGEPVAVGMEAGPWPTPDQQFSDEHVPPSQSKTSHWVLLLRCKESSKTFPMQWFMEETEVIPTGTETRTSETDQIRVDLRHCNIVFQLRNTLRPSKEGKLKFLYILWYVTTYSHYCSL